MKKFTELIESKLDETNLENKIKKIFTQGFKRIKISKNKNVAIFIDYSMTLDEFKKVQKLLKVKMISVDPSDVDNLIIFGKM